MGKKKVPIEEEFIGPESIMEELDATITEEQPVEKKHKTDRFVLPNVVTEESFIEKVRELGDKATIRGIRKSFKLPLFSDQTIKSVSMLATTADIVYNADILRNFAKTLVSQGKLLEKGGHITVYVVR